MEIHPKERQILRAAETLFAARRFHEVTMDDVCREAGVGKGTIYRYFKDKDELFIRLVASGAQEMHERVTGAVDKQASFHDQLKIAIREVLQLFSQKRSLFRITQSEETRAALCTGDISAKLFQNREQLLRLVAEILQRGVAAGAVRQDIHPELMAGALMGIVRNFVWQAKDDIDAENTTAQVAGFFMHGAASREQGERSGLPRI